MANILVFVSCLMATRSNEGQPFWYTLLKNIFLVSLELYMKFNWLSTMTNNQQLSNATLELCYFYKRL